VASGPLSATFSFLAQTSSCATACWQSALSEKNFIKNKFRVCITNKTFSITLYSLSLPWNKNLGNCQEAQNAITPTSRTINNADNFVNICIHLSGFVYLYIIALNSHIVLFVRKIQDKPHLHDFMGVTGTRKFLTFVTAPFLKIID